MQLNITGHHVEITPALKAYVEKKLDRIVRHSDHVLDVHCILTVEKLQQKAEATVNLSGSKIHADAIDANMYMDMKRRKECEGERGQQRQLSEQSSLEQRRDGRRSAHLQPQSQTHLITHCPHGQSPVPPVRGFLSHTTLH